jgi:lipopolysaccharide transport system permease protein
VGAAGSGLVAIPEGPEAARSGSRPLLEVVGGPGGVTRDSLRELWLFREVLWAFARRSVKVRYKQAAIGIGWAVLQPLAAALIFALFFGRLSHLGSEGAPYLLFALAGMAAWTYFSGSASGAMGSLVEDATLLKKVYFPREVLPLGSILAGLVDLVPALGVLFVVAFVYGDYPTLAWLALPLPLLLLMLAAAALGTAVSAVNVYYRDIRYALPFVLQLGLFASPVAYSLNKVPGTWRTLYAILNPVASAIDGLRRIVIHGTWPHFATLAGAYGWTLLLLALGYVFFKRLERGFADRV